MKIRPIRDEVDSKAVTLAAKEDGSEVYCPTHVIRRDDGKIIGAMTIIPMVILWSHHEMKVRESVQVKEFYEGLLANQSRIIAVPCPKDSKYLAALNKPSQGYTSIGEVQLFLKGL